MNDDHYGKENRSTPDQLPPDEPYDVPDDIKGDRGLTLAYVISACYGTSIYSLMDHFDASRQTIFVWRQPGAGIPYSRKAELESLLKDKNEPFRLARNIELKHILKPPRRSAKISHGVRRNPDLLRLVLNITESDLIDALSEQLGPNIAQHTMFKWALSTGGVPTNHIVRVLTAMIEIGVPEHVDMTERAFVPYFMEHLTADPESAATEPLPGQLNKYLKRENVS